MSARTATLAAMEPNPSVVAPPLTSEPSEADAIAAEEKELQGSCKRFVVSHGVRTAGEMLESIGAEVDKDSYGEGGVVAELEEEVAELLAKPAAVFLPTGTMAQQATLRVHADRRGRSTFVAHPACHLDWREGRGYQRLHGLSMRQAGELRRPLSASDLAAVGEAPAALLIELPQRDLGGRLPTWEDLEAQVAWAHDRGAAAHLDGARLWEAAAGYGRPPAAVAALFDTVYVSFYKGLGSIGGCCVAGPAEVVAEVREWRTRHGGTVFGLWPYAASCLTSLRRRLPLMAEYHRHGLAIAAVLRDIPGVDVVPDPPQTSHLHLLFDRSTEELRAAAHRLARERQIWTFSRWASTDAPNLQRVELAVGDATMAFTPEEIGELVSFLLTDEG
jgi:threonine aldolase